VDYRKETVRYYNKGSRRRRRTGWRWEGKRVHSRPGRLVSPGPGKAGRPGSRRRCGAVGPGTEGTLPAVRLGAGSAFVGDRLLIYRRDTIETANDEEILAYLVDPLSGEAVKPLSVPARLPAVTGKVYLTGQLFGEGKLIYTVAEDRDSGSCLVRAIAVDGGTVWEQWYEQPLGRFLLLDGALLSRVGRELWCLDLDQGTRRWSIELGEAYEALAAYDPALYLGGTGSAPWIFGPGP